jgi:hypothetical protein
VGISQVTSEICLMAASCTMGFGRCPGLDTLSVFRARER